MLLAIRERVMGVVGWILLGLLFIAFAFFGLNSYLGSNARTYAVSVNDVEIPVSEQQRSYQIARSRLRERLGEAYDPALIDEELLKKSALEQIIREQLLLQEAQSAGYAVSSDLVAAKIGAVPAFREGDSFSREKYERILRAQGMGTAEFESRLARELMTEQLLNGILKTAALTPETVNEIYRLQAQQRRFKYVRLPAARYHDQVTVTDSEIEDYYASREKEFMSPERVRVQYLELKADSLPVSGDIDEDELRAIYEEQSELYTTEEQRRARHILVSIPPDADEETVTAARDRARKILDRIEQGESFADIAKTDSDDPGSAASGGDLGFFGKGIMDEVFETAVFSLDKGARSDVIRSPFGFHIIEVTDIRPEVVKPFDEVREKLVQDYLTREREELFFEYSEILANLAFEQPDTLAGAADRLELEIMTSDWLGRDGGPGIGEHPEVIDAAFQEDVLENGYNSEPVEVADNDLVVLRVLEHETALVRPLEEVRDEVIRQFRDRKSRELARAEGERLVDELRAGKSIDDIAVELDEEPQDSGLVNRRAEDIDSELVEQAFLLPAPAEDTMPVTGLALPSGDYAILQLLSVKDGDTAGLSAAARSRFTQEVLAIRGASEASAMIDALRQQATIVIPEESN
jgi:peptidyl-prolyl cis-trans isomerase D